MNAWMSLGASEQFVTINLKHQPHKIVKHTKTICWLLLTNCLSVFDHFVGLALKGLLTKENRVIDQYFESLMEEVYRQIFQN